MPLSDTSVRQAKPRAKNYRLTDGGGLYLEVAPNGSRYWRFKYRFDGKEKRLALGVYPTVTLARAREDALSAKRMLHDGIDPQEEKKEKKRVEKIAGAGSFEEVAREWHQVMKPKWTPRHAGDVIEILEKDIFPVFGYRSLPQLKAPEILDAIRKIEKRGAIDIAQRVRQRVSAIFAFAIGCGLAENNPVAAMKGVFATRRKEPRPMLPPEELPQFLVALRGHRGDKMIALGLRLIILTMVRTIELRGAPWSEFDFEKKVWSIPAERMKMRAPHIVPLSRQAIEILEELRTISGRHKLVLPGRSERDKPISENTLLYALYRLGYHSRATTHGFRALASTVLNESGLWKPDAIERQLAHKEQNAVRSAYHRSEYLDERTRMMQWWADFLDAEEARGERPAEKPMRHIR